MRQAHFPYRVGIDAYGNGGFRFANMSHKGSLLALPSGLYAFEYSQFNQISQETLKQVFAEAGDIEILLVGCGETLCLLPEDLRQSLRTHHISADPMSTGAAVRTYNVLASENRAVAAVFIAVE